MSCLQTVWMTQQRAEVGARTRRQTAPGAVDEWVTLLKTGGCQRHVMLGFKHNMLLVGVGDKVSLGTWATNTRVWCLSTHACSYTQAVKTMVTGVMMTAHGAQPMKERTLWSEAAAWLYNHCWSVWQRSSPEVRTDKEQCLFDSHVWIFFMHWCKWINSANATRRHVRWSRIKLSLTRRNVTLTYALKIT